MSVKLKGTDLIIDIDDDIYDSYWWGISYKSIKDKIVEYKDSFTAAKVVINSNGGSVTQGIAIRNEILKLVEDGIDVDVEIAGVAASIASVIALAGTTLTMRQGTYLMIHRPYTFVGGDYEELENTAKTLRKMKDDLIDIYEASSNLSREDIDEKLEAETWITAKEAVEYGFADKMVVPEAGVAMNMRKRINNKSLMISSFNNMPKALVENDESGGETVPMEPQTEGVAMAGLKELLAKNPEAQTELDAQLASVKSEAVADSKKATDAVVARVKGVVASDKYPEQIRNMGMEVLAGTKSIETFEALVIMQDIQNEKENSGDNQDGTHSDGETAPSGGDADNSGKGEGFISSTSELNDHLNKGGK